MSFGKSHSERGLMPTAALQPPPYEKEWLHAHLHHPVPHPAKQLNGRPQTPSPRHNVRTISPASSTRSISRNSSRSSSRASSRASSPMTTTHTIIHHHLPDDPLPFRVPLPSTDKYPILLPSSIESTYKRVVRSRSNSLSGLLPRASEFSPDFSKRRLSIDGSPLPPARIIPAGHAPMTVHAPVHVDPLPLSSSEMSPIDSHATKAVSFSKEVEIIDADPKAETTIITEPLAQQDSNDEIRDESAQNVINEPLRQPQIEEPAPKTKPTRSVEAIAVPQKLKALKQAVELSASKEAKAWSPEQRWSAISDSIAAAKETPGSSKAAAASETSEASLVATAVVEPAQVKQEADFSTTAPVQAKAAAPTPKLPSAPTLLDIKDENRKATELTLEWKFAFQPESGHKTPPVNSNLESSSPAADGSYIILDCLAAKKQSKKDKLTFLLQSKKSTDAEWVDAGRGATTSATVSELLPATSYDLRVAAINTAGTGPWSNMVTISTRRGLYSAPTHLYLLSASPNSLHVQFQPPREAIFQDATTVYRIEKAWHQSGKWTIAFSGLLAGGADTNHRQKVITGLRSSTQYDFRVSAGNEEGFGEVSEIGTFETAAATSALVESQPPHVTTKASKKKNKQRAPPNDHTEAPPTQLDLPPAASIAADNLQSVWKSNQLKLRSEKSAENASATLAHEDGASKGEAPIVEEVVETKSAQKKRNRKHTNSKQSLEATAAGSSAAEEKADLCDEKADSEGAAQFTPEDSSDSPTALLATSAEPITRRSPLRSVFVLFVHLLLALIILGSLAYMSKSEPPPPPKKSWFSWSLGD